MGGFLILIVILVAVWVLFFLPARRRQRSHSAMQRSIEVGDEIITAGGLHAVVKELGDEQLTAEISAGVPVTLDRRAVAAVAREIEVEVEPELEPPPEDGRGPEIGPEEPPQPG